MASRIPTAPQVELPPLPKRLSPSRASNFKQCPLLFAYTSIYRLPTPPTVAQVQGTLAHACLENLFLHPRAERTVDVALSYLQPAWDTLCGRLQPSDEGDRPREDPEAMLALAPPGSETETLLLTNAEKFVRNYFLMEDPTKFDPKDNEVEVKATTGGVPLRGFIDRLDCVEVPGEDGSSESRYYITDYKTGKVPAPDDRYLADKFWAMKVYALLLWEEQGVLAKELRLVYLAGGHPTAIRRMVVTPAMIDSIRRELGALWKAIKKAHRQGEFRPRPNNLCGWCDFKDICPAKNPELVGIPIAELAGIPSASPEKPAA